MYRHHYFEERLNIVSRLLSGEPLATLCRELKMDKKMVRLWYLRYKKYGEDGLRCLRFTRNSHYTADEKLAIVKEFLEKGVTLQELCLRYDLSRSAISTWCRLHRQGLSLENRKRRPRAPMARPKKKEAQTELERLQAENLRLRAENALLKKVKALVEEQEARARLNGQKPSRN
jgi:transposase-like protein